MIAAAVRFAAKNTMFIYDMDDMRILHCGDLGMIPDEETIAKSRPY